MTEKPRETQAESHVVELKEKVNNSSLMKHRSVGLLDVLHEYDCGGLGRKPCQDGPFGASLRQAMRNAG